MRSIWLMILALMTIVFPLPAFAALGEDAASVEADQAHMQAALRTVPAERFTMHEIQAPSGTVVREYASQEGKVFAVAWQGPWLPDMRQILGTYFVQYIEAAAQTTRRGHGPLLIQQPGLVVQLGGHMRAFVGRAYLPQMVPQGMTADEIR